MKRTITVKLNDGRTVEITGRVVTFAKLPGIDCIVHRPVTLNPRPGLRPAPRGWMVTECVTGKRLLRPAGCSDTAADAIAAAEYRLSSAEPGVLAAILAELTAAQAQATT